MSKMKWKPLPDGAVNMDQHRRKLKSWMRKQEQLLYAITARGLVSTHRSACSLAAFLLAVRFRYICFCILLNLAEDIAIEKKMCKRGIVEFLGKGEQGAVMHAPYMGSHTRLLNLGTTCSADAGQAQPEATAARGQLFEETVHLRGEHAQHGHAERCREALQVCALQPGATAEGNYACTRVYTAPPPHTPRVYHQKQGVLRLLFNLSFEPKLRDVMLSNSLVPKLVSLLKLVPFRAITLRLLYHIRFVLQ